MKKLFNIFKRQPKQAEKPKQKSYLQEKVDEELRREKVGVWQKPQINRDAIMSHIFPRKIDSVRATRIATGKGGNMAFATDESVAMDSGTIKQFSSMAMQVPDKILEFYGSHSFIGWQACAVLAQNYMINAACTIPADDAMSPDFVLSYADNNEKQDKDEQKKEVDEQKLIDIKKSACEEFGISDICRQYTKNKKLFGVALAIPVFKNDVDMSIPFNLDGISKGSYVGLKLVEPYWAAPQMDAKSSGDPTSRYFYEPTWWNVGGKLIHRTWCIRVVNASVPDILKPSYYYGGIPLPQMIYERVYAAEKTANEAPLIALTKRMLVADGDIDNMLANPQEAQNIVSAVSFMRDNFGVWFKRSGDQVAQIDTALTDFDALIMTQFQLVATIANMPATKLLKTTPKGFNATGEYEWKDYSQTLFAIQEHDFKPLIKRHLELYTKSEFGKEIPLTVTFNPVDAPTKKEVAEVAAIEAQTDAAYLNAGIVGAEEIRDILRTKEGSRYSTLAEQSADDLEANARAEELLKEDDEQKPDGDKPKGTAADEFIESEHPRDDEGKFSEHQKRLINSAKGTPLEKDKDHYEWIKSGGIGSPPHLKRLFESESFKKRTSGEKAAITEVTPAGYGPSEYKEPEIKYKDKLKGETTEQAIQRYVGYQIENGNTTITPLPAPHSGYHAEYRDAAGFKKSTSFFKKQDAYNWLFNEIYPYTHIKKHESE